MKYEPRKIRQVKDHVKPPKKTIALVAALFLFALPASASAHIYPLVQGTTAGLALHYDRAAPQPLGTVSWNGPGTAFRVTVAWDSASRRVLVGCWGRGLASVMVRVRGRRGVGWTVCRDNGAWRSVFRGVGPGASVSANIQIEPAFRTNAASWS